MIALIISIRLKEDHYHHSSLSRYRVFFLRVSIWKIIIFHITLIKYNNLEKIEYRRWILFGSFRPYNFIKRYVIYSFLCVGSLGRNYSEQKTYIVLVIMETISVIRVYATRNCRSVKIESSWCFYVFGSHNESLIFIFSFFLFLEGTSVTCTVRFHSFRKILHVELSGWYINTSYARRNR